MLEAEAIALVLAAYAGICAIVSFFAPSALLTLFGVFAPTVTAWWLLSSAHAL